MSDDTPRFATRDSSPVELALDWGWAATFFLAASVLAVLALPAYPLRLPLFVSGFALIAFACFAYTRAGHGFDVLHPCYGLFLLLFLYAFSSALFIETEGTTYFGEALLAEVYPRYYATCMAGAGGLACGLALRRFSGVVQTAVWPVPEAANVDLRRTMLWCCLALCILFLPWIAPKFSFWSVRSYYEVALSSRVERLGDDSLGTVDVLTLYLPIVLLLAVCAWAMQDAALAWWQRLLALAAFVAYAATGFLAGERYTILYCGLVFFAYRHFRIAPIRASHALLVGVAAYFLMNLIPILRGSSDPVQMWRALQDNIAARGLSDFSLTYSGELATATNLARHIQGILTGESEFNFGGTVMNDLLVWIPRILYPDRPLPSSELFVETFYPGVRDRGGGYGFFILQEGYWAFGIPGAFVFMAAFGWAVDGLYRVMWRWQRYDLVVFLYAAIYADVVMAAVRSGILGSFKAAMLHAVPFAFVLLVHRLRTRRKAAS